LEGFYNIKEDVMSKTLLFTLSVLLSFSTLAQDLSVAGFKNRFKLEKNAEGKVTTIKLNRATTHFSLRPFFEQLKNDLLGEQSSLKSLSVAQKEAEIDNLLYEVGLDPYAKAGEPGADEARSFKESLLNIDNIDVEEAFQQLDQKEFWVEFERKLNEAFLFLDPTVLANLDDARFFYRKAVTYKVVAWALEEAKKRWSEIPVLNIASFVIVRIHDMMLEQRHFHHNMLLHYFEKVKETELGMTKEEVDRAISSIYEYRIQPTDIFSSNRAARDWLNFGHIQFYMMVRSGNSQVNSWNSPFSDVSFQDVKKLNFAFAEVTEKGNRKIYHLHYKAHMFSGKPSLAYDFSAPKKVKRMRALLNLGEIGLGFIKLPSWLKDNVHGFLKSFYVQQVRMEGALIGHFESTGNGPMMKSIYAQRSNLYILE
jgi:uncharacterized protein (DUF2384 family)